MNSVHDGGHAYRVFDKQGSVCLYSSEEPCLCCGKTYWERLQTNELRGVLSEPTRELLAEQWRATSIPTWDDLIDESIINERRGVEGHAADPVKVSQHEDLRRPVRHTATSRNQALPPLTTFPATAYRDGEPIIAALPNPMRQS